MSMRCSGVWCWTASRRPPAPRSAEGESDWLVPTASATCKRSTGFLAHDRLTLMTTNSKLPAVLAHIDAQRDNFLHRLLDYVRHPSISAHNIGIKEVAGI